jgi:hypothetical protein
LAEKTFCALKKMEKLEATLAGLIKQRCAPENKKTEKKV